MLPNQRIINLSKYYQLIKLKSSFTLMLKSKFELCIPCWCCCVMASIKWKTIISFWSPCGICPNYNCSCTKLNWKEFEWFKCLLLMSKYDCIQCSSIYHLAGLSLGSLCCDKPCNCTVHEAVICWSLALSDELIRSCLTPPISLMTGAQQSDLRLTLKWVHTMEDHRYLSYGCLKLLRKYQTTLTAW